MIAWKLGETLTRTLENVRDFAEVIIADGGSTDETISIAGKYGARVIPQTNPGHPIADFSKERNLLLDVTAQPWFLWLDSDETITDEPRKEMRAICANPVVHLLHHVKYLFVYLFFGYYVPLAT
ncbi:MAG: glycosyltransferase [Candidatus Pacebacteria bacterium]|nr:glycosyltransferase [Candidatus Paceibacterota bacterium]